MIDTAAPALPLLRRLPVRLLLFTVGFVVLAQVLIYLPSIAQFRLNYLNEILATGQLAAMAVEAAPDQTVNESLQTQLLKQVGAYGVDLVHPNASTYVLATETPQVEAEVDLRRAGWYELVAEAIGGLFRERPRVLKLIGDSPKSPGSFVVVYFDEGPLLLALRAYSAQVLLVTLVISALTGGLVYLVLNTLFLKPMLRLTAAMTAFRQAPENQAAAIVPSGRIDEIGQAEAELQAMQTDIRTAMRQRARLAALGIAVAKINHDLRNMLANASLLSERLAASPDPQAAQIGPRLLSALDQAVELCGQTLAYAGEGGPTLALAPLDLFDLVESVGGFLADGRPGCRWDNQVPPGLTVLGDAGQLARVMTNLGHNAFSAGARKVQITAAAGEDFITLAVADDGPGLPPRAQANLFQPFTGKARPGGTGLGLAIAKEIVAAHGGDILLDRTGPDGTVFALALPRPKETAA